MEPKMSEPTLKNLLDLTAEDLLNIQKWQTATSIMIEANMRTPYSDSEHETAEKIKRMVGQIEAFKKELREIAELRAPLIYNGKKWIEIKEILGK